MLFSVTHACTAWKWVRGSHTTLRGHSLLFLLFVIFPTLSCSLDFWGPLKKTGTLVSLHFCVLVITFPASEVKWVRDREKEGAMSICFKPLSSCGQREGFPSLKVLGTCLEAIPLFLIDIDCHCQMTTS